MTMKKALIPVLTTFVLTLGVWPSNSLQASGAAFQDVKALFGSKCASCHALDGSGNTATGKKLKVRDFRSPDVQKMTDAQMESVIGKGKGKMPGYEKSLGADQVKKLVAYSRELAKK